MRFSTNLALPALVLLASSLAAGATTITQTGDAVINVDAPIGGGSEFITFAPFNTTLGTLTGVELVIPGPLTFTPTPSLSSSYSLTYSVPAGSGDVIAVSGTDSAGNYGTLTAFATDFSSFEGSTLIGEVLYSFTNGALVLSDTNIMPNDAEELIYTYTPASTSVTPEPSSLALLGTGMLFGAGALYRRFKHA